jgi:hypothetical protein
MLRTILIYGVLLAAGAFGLQWLEFQFLVRTHAIETWVVLVAIAFMGLGIWVGAQLFRRPPSAPFTLNTRVRETLGVSDREFEVLTLLAAGRSNKEIANQLHLNPLLSGFSNHPSISMPPFKSSKTVTCNISNKVRLASGWGSSLPLSLSRIFAENASITSRSAGT